MAKAWFRKSRRSKFHLFKDESPAAEKSQCGKVKRINMKDGLTETDHAFNHQFCSACRTIEWMEDNL